MKSYKGTRTEANLMSAFAGESMARVRYMIYASKAKKEGYIQIADIFAETSDNEFEHAELWFKELHGGVGDTAANLADAAKGEGYEWQEMYVEFARVAREEGFADLAIKFENVGAIEARHQARYLALLQSVEQNTVFTSPTAVDWQCTKCGHTHNGTEPPARCPVCGHSHNFFVIAK